MSSNFVPSNQEMFQAAIEILDTTPATSTSASLMLNGGLTIFSTQNALNFNSGGSLLVLGGTAIQGNAIIGGNTQLLSTTLAINTSTGSLQVAGGVSIQGSVYGNYSNFNNIQANINATIPNILSTNIVVANISVGSLSLSTFNPANITCQNLYVSNGLTASNLIVNNLSTNSLYINSTSVNSIPTVFSYNTYNINNSNTTATINPTGLAFSSWNGSFFSEKFRFDSTGNFLINTTQASSTLSVNCLNTTGSDGAVIDTQFAISPIIGLSVQGSRKYTIGIDSNDLYKLKFNRGLFSTQANTMTLDQTGNVGIGITLPLATLHVVGTSIFGNITTGNINSQAATISNLSVASLTSNSAIFTSTTISTSTSNGSVVINGGLGIGGDTNIGGSILIGGNLTVNGTTITVNSTNVSITDNFIGLNYKPTGIADSGLQLSRYQIANNVGSGDVVNDYITFSGTVVASTTSTVVFNMAASSTTGFYIGYWIKFTSGLNINQVRQIIAYNGVSKSATLATVLTTNGMVNDTFNLYGNVSILNYFNQSLNAFVLGFTSTTFGSTAVISNYANLYLNNLSSTLVSTSNLQSTSATITNLILPGLSLPNITVTNLISTNNSFANMAVTNQVSSNQVVTNETVANIIASNGSLGNFNINNVTIGNLNVIGISNLSGLVQSINQTCTNATISNAILTNSTYNNLVGTNIISTNISCTNLNSINSTFSSIRVTGNSDLTLGLTSTTNLVSSNTTITNLISLNSTFGSIRVTGNSDLTLGLTSTTNLVSSNTTISNLFSTNTVLINTSISNLLSTNGFMSNATITNAILTTVSISNLFSTISNFTNHVSTNSTIQNLVNTNLTCSNGFFTSLTASNMFANISNFTNHVSTNSTILNLVSTNSTCTNILVTNLSAGTLSLTNSNLVNLTSVNTFITNQTVSNTLATNINVISLTAGTLSLTNLSITNETVINTLSSSSTTSSLTVTSSGNIAGINLQYYGIVTPTTSTTPTVTPTASTAPTVTPTASTAPTVTPTTGLYGSWINMPIGTNYGSGIGSGGPGVNPWIAYVGNTGLWFTNSTVGDLCYKNLSGSLLFGNNNGSSTMQIFNNIVNINSTIDSSRISTTASLLINGGVNISKSVDVCSTNVSINNSTGALVVSGGAGFNGSIYSNNIFTYQGSSTSSILTPSPLTTTGDIYTYSTAGSRLPIGSNGQILAVSNTNLQWVSPLTVSGTYGSDYNYVIAKQTSGTTMTTGTLKTSLTTGTLVGGIYKIEVNYSLAIGTNTGHDSEIAVYINTNSNVGFNVGTTTSNLIHQNIYRPQQNTNSIPFCSTIVQTLNSGVQTLGLYYRNQDNGSSTNIANASILLYRIQ